MSEQGAPYGAIGWHDLTVGDAPGIRDFYAAVVGWQPQPVDMDGYSDFNMTRPDTGEAVAGVCHARGGNADLPAQWLMYLVVPDLATSLAECSSRGGEVIAGPRGLAGGEFAVIRDPAGAVCALWQPAD